MPAEAFYLKYRDTLPVLEVALLDPDGTAHDLTGAAAVHLHVRLGDNVFTRAMVIDAVPTTGIVTYAWAATDWTNAPALVPGYHRMEYEVTHPGGARLTFPNGNDGIAPEHDELRIVADIGQA